MSVLSFTEDEAPSKEHLLRFIGESCKSGMLPCCLLLNWNWTMVIAFSALKQGYLLITLPWPYMVNNIGIELDKDFFSFSIFLIGGHN